MEIRKRVGPIRSAFVLGIAFIMLGWLYLMLVGVTPPNRQLPRRG